MLSSILFILCVALNTWLIWLCLSAPLRAAVGAFLGGLRRVPPYLARPLGPTREKALRLRTLRLLQQSGLLMAGIAGIAVLYLPSMLFAAWRTTLADAFLSIEALFGMLVGAASIGWRGRRP